MEGNECLLNEKPPPHHHSLTQTHTLTDPNTHTHTPNHTLTHTHTLTQSSKHTLTHPNKHSLAQAHTLTHPNTHPNTHTHSLAQTQPNGHTRAPKQQTGWIRCFFIPSGRGNSPRSTGTAPQHIVLALFSFLFPGSCDILAERKRQERWGIGR